MKIFSGVNQRVHLPPPGKYRGKIYIFTCKKYFQE